ncbi:hypothetical protein K469DRAFT_701755 [Zopfia rhizophila CBS 207.26]|uniref:Uncharacterized protein n=1 Tax=Zopfia rhizophila CBS 207.26 TaxID=1314779 RepID=A0A6A6EH12_9PEZI|nr:hypothetical protein K469DRAFT_701755 [Zopfia rhizophila CBS 207.26]
MFTAPDIGQCFMLVGVVAVPLPLTVSLQWRLESIGSSYGGWTVRIRIAQALILCVYYSDSLSSCQDKSGVTVPDVLDS